VDVARGAASCAAEGVVRLNAADFLMGVLSSARFAQLARIGSVVRSVRPAFLGSGQLSDNLDGSNLGSLRDALRAKEGFTEAATFGCWPMMGRARPKMGLAGQRDVSTGKSSRPAGQMTSGITLENQPNLDLGVLGEVVSMLICLMARLMQQYRCRGGRHEAFPS
jgi:hypothetical protein